jgi:hypothetical protein
MENYYGNMNCRRLDLPHHQVYEVNGKQFLVIACGGGKLGTRSGDALCSFCFTW